MLQSTAVVVAIATILLISALPYSGAKSIGEKYDEIVRARQQRRFHYRRPWSPPDQDKSNQFKAQSNKFTTKEARHIKLATRKNIGEEQYGELLRARHQEAFHYRRTPEYDESNHFTAEEAQVMREARRKEKEMLKAMGISEQQEKAKISLLFESQKVKADEEQVNEHAGVTNLFEGDIVLTKGQEAILTEANKGGASEQAFQTHFLYLWNNGVVPYVLDRSLNQESINAIHDAMDEMDWETYGCIEFEQRRKQEDYIRFISDYGCWSEIGKIGGVQEISIENTDPEGYTCAEKGIVMHEIFHALGRFHEQNRPDRDDYVTIAKKNIGSGQEHNFDKQPASVASTQGVEYDFESIMHYGPYDFAVDPRKPVITSKTGEVISGQREHLTYDDVYHAIAAYCPLWLEENKK